MTIHKNFKNIFHMTRLKKLFLGILCISLIGSASTTQAGIDPLKRNKSLAAHQISNEKLRQALPVIYQLLVNSAKPLCLKKNCHQPLVILEKNMHVNAYTDGKKIYISRGMLNFVKTTEEMATVLSHEMPIT